jgi:hypothetical protein
LALAFAGVADAVSDGGTAAVAASVGAWADSAGAARNACGGDETCDALATAGTGGEASGAGGAAGDRTSANTQTPPAAKAAKARHHVCLGGM